MLGWFSDPAPKAIPREHLATSGDTFVATGEHVLLAKTGERPGMLQASHTEQRPQRGGPSSPDEQQSPAPSVRKPESQEWVARGVLDICGPGPTGLG